MLRCHLGQQTGVPRSLLSKGKIVTAAEFSGSHSFDQHPFHKFAGFHILKAVKLRHHHHLEAHLLEQSALLFIGHQGRVVLFILRDLGRDGIGKNAGSKLPAVQRRFQHLPVSDMQPIEQTQRNRRALPGRWSYKIPYHFQIPFPRFFNIFQ